MTLEEAYYQMLMLIQKWVDDGCPYRRNQPKEVPATQQDVRTTAVQQQVTQ